MKTSNLLIIRLLSNIFGHKHLIRRFLYDVTTMHKVNGLPFTIKYMKAVKLHITRFISGHPLTTNAALVSVTDGFPTKFLYLKGLTKSKDGKRLLLSLLSFTRGLKPLNKEIPKVDYSSITNPYKGKEYTIPNFYIEKFIKDFNLKCNLPSWDNDLHYISSKSSPFGKATLSGLYGLFYMMETGSKVLVYITNILGPLAKIIFTPVLEHVYSDHRSFHYLNKTPQSTGKLSIVEDPELKRRVIAMVDYYSQ
jgi:hypothetical protein